MIIGEVSPPINLVTVDRAKDAQNINTVNFLEQNDVEIAMEVRTVNSAGVLFPEMQDFHRRISKKYASMLDLQDKAISTKEKKRRDQAMKRNKRSGKENGILEVDGSS
ncbi:hypothetical protein V6N11_056730 [Hibiscus sabdariffa]|uniref:Uncharacterized protein n=1 Tax=Hibiscus sabdariffa TaxID=183260 RepID=A0ABR2T5N3_9ROSI